MKIFLGAPNGSFNNPPQTGSPQILNNLSEEIIVTKRGKAIAKIVLISQKKKVTPGTLRHTVSEMADIISPLEEEWDAGK